MEDIACTLQEFRYSYVLSFVVHVGLSYLPQGNFPQMVFCLNMPKINCLEPTVATSCKPLNTQEWSGPSLEDL